MCPPISWNDSIKQVPIQIAWEAVGPAAGGESFLTEKGREAILIAAEKASADALKYIGNVTLVPAVKGLITDQLLKDHKDVVKRVTTWDSPPTLTP